MEGRGGDGREGAEGWERVGRVWGKVALVYGAILQFYVNSSKALTFEDKNQKQIKTTKAIFTLSSNT